MTTGEERAADAPPHSTRETAGAGGVAPGQWGLMPDTGAGGLREVLRHWFVRYNPLYFASALSVFAGVYLVTGDLDRQQALSQTQAQIALFAVINAYEWMLVGAAAWLVWRGVGGRAAAILGLLELLFLYDCSFRLESVAHLGASGTWASVAWLALAAARLWLLARALRLVVPAVVYAVAIGGAAGIATFVQLLTLGIGEPYLVYQGAAWFGLALMLVLRSRRPQVVCTLARRPADRIKAARALTAAPWLLAGFYFYHLWNHLLWVGGAEAAALFAQAAVALLAIAIVARGEREVWIATLASVVFMAGLPPLLWVAALLGAAVLAWKVRRGAHERLLVGAVLLVWVALLTVGWQEEAPPVRGRVGADAWQTWLLVAALVHLGWRRRLILAWVVLAAGVLFAARDIAWPTLPLPQTPLAWGLLLLVAGFVALVVGVAVNWLLRATPGVTTIDDDGEIALDLKREPLLASTAPADARALTESGAPPAAPTPDLARPENDAAAPADDPLAGYAAIIAVDVAWGDMDAFSHVNNAFYFRYVESARINWLSNLGREHYEHEHALRFVVTEVGARFRRPVTFPDRLRIGTRAKSLLDDRLELEHLLYSDGRSEVVTIARSLVVAVDTRTGVRRALPADLRAHLDALLGSRR